MVLVQDRMHTLAQDKPDAVQSLPASWWKGLCCWLTTNLKDMEMTLERREGDGEWKIECHSHPLESVTTHQMPNGVQILSIHVGMNGKSRVFQIAGPSSILLYKAQQASPFGWKSAARAFRWFCASPVLSSPPKSTAAMRGVNSAHRNMSDQCAQHLFHTVMRL